LKDQESVRVVHDVRYEIDLEFGESNG